MSDQLRSMREAVRADAEAEEGEGKFKKKDLAL
jgi:hypothetical protein